MSSPPANAQAHVEHQLCQAVQQGTIDETLAELGQLGADHPASARIASARAARQELVEHINHHHESLRSVFGDKVTNAAHGLPVARLAVEVGQVDSAADTLEGLGFYRPLALHPGAWKALTCTRGVFQFVRTDGSPMRVEMTWANPSGPRSGKFRPDDQQLTRWKFPAPLWRLYQAVAGGEAIISRLRRRPPIENLGPLLSTPPGVGEQLIEMAGLDTDSVVVDLGCGDGRLLIAAALTSGCRAVGYEYQPELVTEAARLARAAGVGDLVRVEVGDAAAADLSEATHVVIFLPAAVTQRLVPLLLARMPAGALLLAHEVEGFTTDPAPDRQRALFARDGMTVLNIWKVP